MFHPSVPKLFNLLTPKTLERLRELGHADHVIFADGNFAATADAKTKKRIVWLTGYTTLELVEMFLEVMPLDDPKFGPPAGYIVEKKRERKREPSRAFIELVKKVALLRTMASRSKG